jgi:hypothetical protein
VPRPKKYHTEEERREAARQSHRKYVEANREAIRARQAERDSKRRAAAKAGQKETQASSFREVLETQREYPRAGSLGGDGAGAGAGVEPMTGAARCAGQ